MVKKLQKTAGRQSGKKASAGQSAGTAFNRTQFASNVKESAQQIWLAGLGAFNRAQAEGSKVFDALVREGTSMQRKSQAVAEEKITEATSRVASMATDIGSKAQGQWDKLENIFEERVGKALGKLGVPSAKDVDTLLARIDALEARLASREARAAKPARKAAPRTAAKAAAPSGANGDAKPARRRKASTAGSTAASS